MIALTHHNSYITSVNTNHYIFSKLLSLLSGKLTRTPNQTFNQNNNNQLTVNLQAQGFLGDNKIVNQLEDLFSNLINQQDQINQNRLRQLNGASLARRGEAKNELTKFVFPIEKHEKAIVLF